MRILASTKLTAEMEQENQQKLKTGSFITMLVGIVGLLAYIVIAVAFFDEGKEPGWLNAILWISALAFGFGLVFFITAKKVVTKTAQSGFSNEYVFEDECVLVTSFRGGEKIGEVKHYYSDFTKIRTTKNYLFLHLGAKGAYPIELSQLGAEDLTAIKETVGKWLKK